VRGASFPGVDNECGRGLHLGVRPQAGQLGREGAGAGQPGDGQPRGAHPVHWYDRQVLRESARPMPGCTRGRRGGGGIRSSPNLEKGSGSGRVGFKKGRGLSRGGTANQRRRAALEEGGGGTPTLRRVFLGKPSCGKKQTRPQVSADLVSGARFPVSLSPSAYKPVSSCSFNSVSCQLRPFRGHPGPIPEPMKCGSLSQPRFSWRQTPRFL